MTISKRQKIDELVLKMEEATRSTSEGVKRFIEPASGALTRAKSKRHHIVFGRRGSGKSSLLRKAEADLTIERRPIAYIDLETFKGHSYPDVLISVLIRSFEGFIIWLETAAIYPSTKTSFWQRLFGAGPSRGSLDKDKAKGLVNKLNIEISYLRDLLSQADSANVSRIYTSEEESKNHSSVAGGITAGPAKIDVKLGTADRIKASTETGETFLRTKTDFLHRHILDYQTIFKQISDLSGQDCFLLLDDLYHIRQSSQADVLDYFHRIAKGTGLWIKAGTIRHRSNWYRHGDPPIGLKLGDDADEIDLDLSLEKYALAKQFLTAILKSFLTEYDLQVGDVLTDGALDRLVLASGGVARDFLGLFRRSVAVSHDRQVSKGEEDVRIGAEDVNNAAGEYESTKREELSRDTLDERSAIENEFEKIRQFCTEKTQSSVFLVKKDSDSSTGKLVYELVDLRLVHKIRSRVTVRDRAGQIFEGFMLDISQYTGSRKRRGFEILEFWREDEDAIRKTALIFEHA